MYLQRILQVWKPPLTIHSAHYNEILPPFHTVRQNSDLVQKFCLGNQNTKIEIKWKNPCFCVLTSLYSEGQRK